MARRCPAVEIVPDSGVFDYESRYTAGLTTYYTPARLSPDAATAAAALAIGAHQALGLQDVLRTDAIVDADGQVQFLEVNVSPGLTETSMFPMSASLLPRCRHRPRLTRPSTTLTGPAPLPRFVRTYPWELTRDSSVSQHLWHRAVQ